MTVPSFIFCPSFPCHYRNTLNIPENVLELLLFSPPSSAVWKFSGSKIGIHMAACCTTEGDEETARCRYALEPVHFYDVITVYVM